MLRIRLCEESFVEPILRREVFTPCHLYSGEEAVAVGLSSALSRDDYVFGNHRSHGHFLAKGGSMKEMVAEIYCRVDGCSRGRGGSMHLIDLGAGFLGAVPIVGSTIPIAVGAAFGARMRGEDRVAVVFFGDAAAEEGVLHESLSFASLEKLPVLFVCENNLYSVQTPLSERQPPGRAIHELAEGHRVAHLEVHGEDVFQVFEAAREAATRARAGAGPTFLEVATYRYLEHVGPYEDVDLGYRTQAEIDAWRARDPIATATRTLLAQGCVTAQEIDRWAAEQAAEIDDAFERALDAPSPPASALHEGVFAGTRRELSGGER